MAIIDIFYIVASVSLVVICAALIPVLAQVKQTARKAEITLETLNKDMEPLLQRVTEVSEELQILSASLNEKIEKTDHIIDTVQYAGDTLLTTSKIIRDTVTPVVAQIGGISAGIAAFTSFFKKPDPSARRYFDE